jgi:hypothetical protein
MAFLIDQSSNNLADESGNMLITTVVSSTGPLFPPLLMMRLRLYAAVPLFMLIPVSWHAAGAYGHRSSAARTWAWAWARTGDGSYLRRLVFQEKMAWVDGADRRRRSGAAQAVGKRSRAQGTPAATSAAEAVIGISQVAGIMPDEIRQFTKALEAAASATRLVDTIRLANRAAVLGRRVEAEIQERMEEDEIEEILLWWQWWVIEKPNQGSAKKQTIVMSG